jgi:small GTP-binding protein
MADNNQLSITAIKIGLLGDSKVGKTAICERLLNLEFSGDSIGTIGNVKLETKFPLKNGKEIKLILWDSAGQERFRSVAMGALKAVKGMVLVFDVTSKKTFDNIDMWIEEINEKCNNPCLVLFGNKIDLDPSLRQVTNEDIKNYCEKRNLVYFETSAKTKKGIMEGFEYIVNEAVIKAQQYIISNNIVINNTNKNNKKEKSGCFGKKKNKKNKKTKKKVVEEE